MPAPLWVKSNASFLAGASHPEELVQTAHEMGHTHLALTDKFGVYGTVRAHRAAQRCGLHLIVGAELSIAGVQVVLLAPDRCAYGQLCRLLSQAQLAAPKKGEASIDAATLAAALDCEQGDRLLALCPSPALLLRLAERVPADRLRGLCVRHQSIGDAVHEAALEHVANRYGVPIVANSEVLYHARERRALLDVVRCIGAQVPLDQAARLLPQNAEHALRSPEALRVLFADRPEWLEEADAVAGRCTFTLGELHYRYPVQDLPEGQQQSEHLRARVLAGAATRFAGRTTSALWAQLNQELDVIAALDYAGYFLSMQDIVRFCGANGILCQGRGSAANSAVCFALGITAVDPTRIELLFSRFLSKARAEPPDIDLDIEHRRREEVIQWVYNRHGRSHAAMVANVVRFRWRSALRQVGGVLGLPAAALDTLAGRIGYAGEAHPGAAKLEIDWNACLQGAGLDPAHARVRHLVHLAGALRSFPRHLSVHPGGFVLGTEPIDTLCAVEPASMPGRTVVQWDKDDVDDLGIFKVDLLGLGALHHIHLAFDEIKRTEDTALSLHTIAADDANTYAMLGRAESMGVFQVESRAQMSMLPRLKPRTFYDLVVQVAIVRPGPIQGDMVHPYLLQREKNQAIAYPHPGFAAILDKTFGVPIFQEQVMRLAILAAHYTPDEADQLRRDMAAWRSQDRLEGHRQRIVDAMLASGLDRDFAERLFSQIRGFGEYGFPESHAASFAHIVYATAYLRCHYLAAFICGLLNAQPMGFYAPFTLLADAQRHGLLVLPVDVQHSGWDCHLVPHAEAGPHRFAVRMGLRYVRQLGERERAHLAAAGPPYHGVDDLVRRTRLGRRALDQLAQAGALDSLATAPAAASASAAAAPVSGLARRADRRTTLWQVRRATGGRNDELALPNCAPEAAWQKFLQPLSGSERVHWDVAHSGHSTAGHPMQSLRRPLAQRGYLTVAEAAARADGGHVRCMAQVICRQRPETARGILFLSLEDETGVLNVIVRPEVQARFAQAAATAPVVGVCGRMQVQGAVVHVLAQGLVVPEELFGG